MEKKTRWRPLEDIFVVTLTLNCFVLLSTRHVPSFMLLSQNARFLLKLLHIRPTSRRVKCVVSIVFVHLDLHSTKKNCNKEHCYQLFEHVSISTLILFLLFFLGGGGGEGGRGIFF